MAPIDYKTLLAHAFEVYGNLLQDRQNLDLELARQKQFIKATMNMLPDEDREVFNLILENYGGELGLTDAIRKVLQNNPKKSFTATEVRDKLKEAKFDFSSYKANPLASIHAVLKRLKAEEVESTEIDGVAAWRWVGETSAVYPNWTKKMFVAFPQTPLTNFDGLSWPKIVTPTFNDLIEDSTKASERKKEEKARKIAEDKRKER
jgi:hypothetical protein